MAENKKKVVVYIDWLNHFEDLTDEELGKLMRHFFEYINDLNPVLEDRLLKIAWKPIENALKRDLKKWEQYIDKQKDNGSKGGRPKKPKETQKTQAFIEKPKKAVNVNDNVNEIIDKSITYTKGEFINDWNTLRTEHLKKPSFVKKLSNYDDDSNFKDLVKDYSRDDFKKALIGLFKQKKLPNGNTTMQSNPSHFLKFFNSYHTAYHDQNDALYGKEK